jgi:Reverse transcriptase (RNA-dependent DNA polymerase)
VGCGVQAQTAEGFDAGPVVPVPLRFAAAHEAWRKARRGKKLSANQLAFESRWLDGLLQLHADLRAGAWRPGRTVSFVVKHPKTREIHAPDFADRVVHHILVPRLEALYEPVFIHDSYANRQGKGSHAVVDRLQGFLRARNGRGWFLQLDVHNFFNSIHRPTLYALLKDRLAKAQRAGRLPPSHALALQSLCHKLLAHPVQEICRNPLAAAQVPPLAQGIDFLGYVVWATHRRVRARVVAHCRQKLEAWAQRHVRVTAHGRSHAGAQGWQEIRAGAPALEQLRAVLASYWGHFAHARSVRLRRALFARFEWLGALFYINPAGDLSARWVLQGETLARQTQWLREQWPAAVCELQKGFETLRFAPLKPGAAPEGCRVRAEQTGWLRHGSRRREISGWRLPLNR